MAVEELPAREAMEFDVVIVGAGPAGLAAAIRIKQNAPDISVVIVEKGAEVGAHILSGAVIDPIGLDRLLPGWREEETPIKTAVTDDRFYMLGAGSAVRLPNILMPRLMNNHGNFVVSLGNVCRWLAGKAEALGVDIYPGFAATELLFDEKGAVVGVATGDMGIAKSGKRKETFTRGMELHARYTLFAEGARALTEGGWQSVPKLTFPGGALVGCAAGFMNVPRIKGSHNAILSGILAADHVTAALAAGRANNDELAGYDAAWRAGDIGRDL